MLREETLKTVFSVKIKKYSSNSKMIILRTHQKGSILVGLIITMVIMASLGAGMLYVTTTSTFQELFANNHARAYYAAESGGNYMNSLIRQDYATGSILSSSIGYPNTTEFTMLNGDKFQIKKDDPPTILSNGSKQISFYSTGIVNSGLLQAKRMLHYSINPSNQSGVGTPAQTITPDLSTMVALAGTDPLPNNSPVPITVSGDTGIKLTPSGGNAKAAIVVTSGSPITLTGDYSVQVKTASPNANAWMVGILFNINPGSATSTGLPDGYGLTYFFNWGDQTPPDSDIYTGLKNSNGISISPPYKTAGPMLILWQSVTTDKQRYNWIAYKNLDLTSLPGYLTQHSDDGNYYIDPDAVALVAQVDRTSSPEKNIIRVYYGSPNPDHTNLGLGTGDNVATNNTPRLNYNLSNIQWPVPTASWHCGLDYCNDYFTLVGWDGINPNLAGTAALSGDGAIALNTVITSTVLTTVNCPNCNSVALYTNAATKKQVDFFDYSIFVPGTGGGADGGGGVSVSP